MMKTVLLLLAVWVCLGLVRFGEAPARPAALGPAKAEKLLPQAASSGAEATGSPTAFPLSSITRF
ncbi:hypothetical protein SAMN02745146_1504 [Hymenobacter daecheongensis DSM 21074]|uniref:Uncharacterized protein n=1 Tax=Hymenobacter daecheongensis DSM 21074 TaxID=1121955 RepID=A0A1M6DGR2_9BACT|nr:hypothetical protein SAMN02745146_1504 [Hymenobacter daecheongensis DSM 21074]